MNELNQIGSIAAQFLQFNNVIQLYHWATTSHSRHVSSGYIYTSMNELTDKFVEVLQGSRLGRININSSIPVRTISDSEASDYLISFRTWLQQQLPLMLNPNTDTDLLNIRDEMLAEINRTLYLFSQS